MTRLVDIQGRRLTLYGAKALEEEICLMHEESVIRCVAYARNITEDAAAILLINATQDNPVEYGENVYWTELPLES